MPKQTELDFMTIFGFDPTEKPKTAKPKRKVPAKRNDSYHDGEEEVILTAKVGRKAKPKIKKPMEPKPLTRAEFEAGFAFEESHRVVVKKRKAPVRFRAPTEGSSIKVGIYSHKDKGTGSVRAQNALMQIYFPPALYLQFNHGFLWESIENMITMFKEVAGHDKNLSIVPVSLTVASIYDKKNCNPKHVYELALDSTKFGRINTQTGNSTAFFVSTEVQYISEDCVVYPAGTKMHECHMASARGYSKDEQTISELYSPVNMVCAFQGLNTGIKASIEHFHFGVAKLLNDKPVSCTSAIVGRSIDGEKASLMVYSQSTVILASDGTSEDEPPRLMKRIMPNFFVTVLLGKNSNGDLFAICHKFENLPRQKRQLSQCVISYEEYIQFAENPFPHIKVNDVISGTVEDVFGDGRFTHGDIFKAIREDGQRSNKEGQAILVDMQCELCYVVVGENVREGDFHFSDQFGLTCNSCYKNHVGIQNPGGLLKCSYFGCTTRTALHRFYSEDKKFVLISCRFHRRVIRSAVLNKRLPTEEYFRSNGYYRKLQKRATRPHRMRITYTRRQGAMFNL